MGQDIGQANHYGDITKRRMDVSGSAGEQARGIESILATASVGGTACAISATVGWWTSSANTATASANTDEMNQLCRVCGEPAAGFHFGAFTCEGCKSFFGRTYNNVGSISECKNGGVCVINKKNRTACKACRLRKCLIVGMSKSGSRYGRRSNWFKIHCLLQEQSHQAQTRFIKDPKSAYEKTFSVLDAANNNNNNNNNETPSTTSASSVVSMVTTATTTANSYHHHHHHHHLYSHYSAEEKASKREDPTILRSHDNPLQLRLQDSTPERTSCETVFRSAELARSPHELLRPEASRFPMWRGPPFLHPALTHMQLLNAPFFPFQQRFIMPYVNQVGGAQLMASLSASSSESVSPRSTPSLKDEGENRESRNEERCQAERGCEVDKDCQRAAAGAEAGYDKSLAYLKSLGPEQEEPIDLSMKNPMTRPARADVGSTEGEEGEEEEEEEEREERSTDTENDELPQDTGPPLDLTRKT